MPQNDIYNKVTPLRISELLLILLIIIGFPVSLYGQMDSSVEKVEIEVKLSHNKIKPGSEFSVAVILNIKESWHLNAHEPTLDYLIGTEIDFASHDQIILSDVTYPEPSTYDFEFADGQELKVYSGETIIFANFVASEGIETGVEQLEASMTLQACDNEICLAPEDTSITFSLDVAGPDDEVQEINDDIFAGYEGTSVGELDTVLGNEVDEGQIAALFEEGRILWAFIALFLIGLALNLTPCVYPMLSVTVSVFGVQKDNRIGLVFLKAIIYVLGIASMYSVLGVSAAFTGGLFGTWLQNPLLLGGIGLLFLLLALGMFGVYEMRLPYWLQNRLGASNSTGFAGVFFSGLVVGIFAAPCIGPPIIALLTFVGTQGDPWFGFQSFFVLSLGLGFPYLILGTFSGLLHRLPQSGEWMIWVKKVFGVVLIGLGLFYVGLALYPEYNLYLIVITLVLGGVYLGFIESSGKNYNYFQYIKWTTGIVSMIIGFMIYQNLQQEGISWQEYSDEKIDKAIEEGQPVVIDFYADWCIPCIELEQMTFTETEVVEATSDMTRLKVDLTHFDSPEAEQIREEYNISGVPTIVFLASNGEEVEDARIIGFVDGDEFLNRVEMVHQSTAVKLIN